MKKVLLFALVMFFVSSGYTSFAQVSSASRTHVVATKVDKSRGASQYKLPTIDVAVPKPDKKTRGTCCINFDNGTGYTIFIWVDGVFKGTVNAWQDGSVCIGSDWAKWYARTAGENYEWNGEGDCQGDYTLKLK